MPLLRAAAVLLPVLPLPPLRAGDEPPPGPPWVRSYAAAKQRGLEKGLPVFVYFTKTH
jgi:hypothetical protein